MKKILNYWILCKKLALKNALLQWQTVNGVYEIISIKNYEMILIVTLNPYFSYHKIAILLLNNASFLQINNQLVKSPVIYDQ